MKNKILVLGLMISLAIYPVLAGDIKDVSICSIGGGEVFMGVPSNMDVTYIYTSGIPQNGVLLLSMPDNDTYIVRYENSIEVVTVNKNEPNGIIETIFVWLGL